MFILFAHVGDIDEFDAPADAALEDKDDKDEEEHEEDDGELDALLL